MGEIPLEGIRILDLSRALAGPFCTLMLGDMGADVVKIEMPKIGDEARHWGPPFVHGESAYFLSVNRNKRSVTLNLKSDRGKRLFEALVAKSDGVVENFRPGAMQRLGLDYHRLRSINERLIYCSITGFGPTGPDADRPGYDLIAQGMGGIMSFTGEPGGQPLKVGVSQADVTAGMFAAYGIVVALYQRQMTGQGRLVETSLFESQIAQLTFQAGRYFATGDPPVPMGNQHPLIAPYESFRTRDGYINIAVGNNAMWSTSCKVLGLEAYEKDPRFETNPRRVENRAALIQLIEEKTSQLTLQQVRERLDQAGIPNGPVWNVKEVLTSPQASALNMVRKIHHDSAGDIDVTGDPVKLDRRTGEFRFPPPVLGQHNEEILVEWLGLSLEEIEELQEAEVI